MVVSSIIAQREGNLKTGTNEAGNMLSVTLANNIILLRWY